MIKPTLNFYNFFFHEQEHFLNVYVQNCQFSVQLGKHTLELHWSVMILQYTSCIN